MVDCCGVEFQSWKLTSPPQNKAVTNGTNKVRVAGGIDYAIDTRIEQGSEPRMLDPRIPDHVIALL